MSNAKNTPKTAIALPKLHLTPIQKAENWLRDVFHSSFGVISDTELQRLIKMNAKVYGRPLLTRGLKDLQAGEYIERQGTDWVWPMMKSASLRTALKKLEGIQELANGDGMLAQFEKGVSADPTVNMDAEDKAKWKKENEAHKEQFTKAADTDKIDRSEAMIPTLGAEKMPSLTDALADLGQLAAFDPDAAKVIPEGKQKVALDDPIVGINADLDEMGILAEGCPDNLNESECKEWEANTDKYEDKFKTADLLSEALDDLGEMADWEPGRVIADADLGLLAEGCPDNLDGSECDEWEANTEKYKDVVKDQHQAGLDQTVASMEMLAKEDYPWEQCIKDKSADPKVRNPEALCGWIKAKSEGKIADAETELERLAKFREGESVDVPEYLKEHGNPEAAEKWEAMNEEHGDQFKTAKRLSKVWVVMDGGPDAEMTDVMYETTVEGLGDYVRGASDWKRLRPSMFDNAREAKAEAEKRIESQKGKTAVSRKRLTRKQAADFVNLWAAVIDKKNLLGVTDEARGKTEAYWAAKAKKRPFDIVPLKHVPLELAQDLSDQTFSGASPAGLAAWKIAQKFVPSAQKLAGMEKIQDEPEEEPKAEKTAGRAAGLYGFTKRVQGDCEVATRKLQKTAAQIARDAYNKDEDVAPFLSTHTKRANSLPAKILTAALKDLGPKLASDRTAEWKDWDQDMAVEVVSAKGAEVFQNLAMARKRYPDLDPRKNGSQFTVALKSEVAGKPALRFETHEAHKQLSMSASEKTAMHKKDWGLYGFKAKTANLGVSACSGLREAAGHIASGLHGRRADNHEHITGFLKAHAKEAGCLYSRMLHAGYPDADRRCASAPPTKVAEWLAWED